MKLVLLALLSLLPLAAATAQAVDPELATIKQRLRDSLLPTTPGDRQRLHEVAARYAGTLRPDGSWPEIIYADSTPSGWQTADHLARALAMAKACVTPEQAMYRDRKAIAGTLSALQFWLNGDYKNSNWWWNEIGVPQQIAEIVILLEDERSLDQKAGAITILKRSPLSGTGANLLWQAGNNVMRGLIAGDPALVKQAYDRIYQEIRVVGVKDEGVMPDFSFHQHGAQFYSGGYGYFFGNDNARFVSFALGTRFEAPASSISVLSSYLLDGQQWMVRGPAFDYSAIGREITRKGKVAVPKDASRGPISPVGPAYGLGNAARLMSQLSTPRQAELQALSARLNGDPGARPLIGHRHFWNSDYTAHHRAGYFASVRMFSTRLLNTEIVNSEGKKSHHLADGCNMIYRTGLEYADIFPVWDWEHIPGTTVERLKVPFTPSNPQMLGKSSFVGGVCDGMYGSSAMDLKRDSLEARKAWFFFDDEYVCLGAGITCTEPDPVITTLNQCLLDGPICASNDAKPVGSGERVLPGQRWVLHDGVGYWFPHEETIHLRSGPRTGKWSDIGTGSATPVTLDAFDLWLDHGTGPQDASYEYVVVPGTDVNALDARTKDSPLNVVTNTPDVQAVRHIRLGILQAAFRKPGAISDGAGWTIGVDKPCVLLVRETADGLEIAAANPENAALDLHVAIDRELVGPDCESRYGRSVVTVHLPGGDLAGSSVVKTYADHTRPGLK